MSSKNITLYDLYKKYNYPCWDLGLLSKNIVPLPYIPIKEVNCDHKYSLEYKKWKEIVMTYLKYVKLYLFTGKEFKLPHFMGTLQLRKYKGGGIDWGHFHQTGDIIKHKNRHTLGYRPILKWYRNRKICKLKFKWHWSIYPSKKVYNKEISNWLMEDFSRINKLINI